MARRVVGMGLCTDLFGNNALIVQVFAQPLDDFDLFFGGQADNGGFDDATNAGLVNSNKTLVVHVGKEAHDKLTVHPVGHASMTWDTVAKVLDLKGSLETRREESTERRYKGRKGCKNQDVELHVGDPDGVVQTGPWGQVVWAGCEYWIWSAFKTRVDV